MQQRVRGHQCRGHPNIPLRFSIHISRSIIMRKVSLLLLLTLLTLIVAAPSLAQDFSGQKVVVVTQTGSAIGGPVLDKGPIWEAATGGSIELQTFAFGELFEKIVTALSTGSGDYDVLIYAADWAGDIMAPGYVMEIPASDAGCHRGRRRHPALCRPHHHLGRRSLRPALRWRRPHALLPQGPGRQRDVRRRL